MSKACRRPPVLEHPNPDLKKVSIETGHVYVPVAAYRDIRLANTPFVDSFPKSLSPGKWLSVHLLITYLSVLSITDSRGIHRSIFGSPPPILITGLGGIG